jgi:hypothetical protein
MLLPVCNYEMRDSSYILLLLEDPKGNVKRWLFQLSSPQPVDLTPPHFVDCSAALVKVEVVGAHFRIVHRVKYHLISLSAPGD